jgi:NAD(P)-dependent dehydrogenase (short-subunit alcohol dehydrogenase family)
MSITHTTPVHGDGQLLDGKVAVITGAAKGLGAAIAQRFEAEGATVVGADITPGEGEYSCDVTDEAQVEALVAETVARHGRLDVMVACAGVATVQPIVQMPLAEWRRVLSVDLDGVFLCTKHAGAAMAAAGGGVILNIASIKAFGGAPATAHYGAAKAGVVSLSKTAALELRAFGVRVNAICPGWVGTDMVMDRRAELEAVLGLSFDEYIAHVQGRLGEPHEVAALAAFLASDRARFTSGAAFVVDGGARASLV